MTKWEYLVVGSLTGYLKGTKYESGGEQIGLKMNDEDIRFKTNMEGQYERIDRKCKIYKKWYSFGHHQFLNDLGNEGWELIKSSGSYLFKRPLK